MSDASQSRPTKSAARKQKFYVRSGEARWVVLAADVDIAALRFVQNALNGSLVSDKQLVSDKLQLLDREALKPLTAKLDSKILVSESGFSNSEAGEFATGLVVNRWLKQIAALEKLIRSTS